jgi:septal ring factor EnvC (AmiA/AmiB activator)
MKIIIIILICLFFSLSISPINELFVPIQAQAQSQSTEQVSAKTQPQSDGSLQAQINMLSTQMQTTNAMALEAKQKSDKITSQIDQIKQELEKQVDT